MKRILIYVQDSKGELDWISPFIKSSSSEFKHEIFLDGLGATRYEKNLVINEYGLGKHVKLVDIDSVYGKNIWFIYRVLRKIRGYVNNGIEKLGLKKRSLDFLFLYCLRFLSNFSKLEKNHYDYIFRDYNLKDSLGLAIFLEKNISAKVIVYPHAAGIQQSIGRRPPVKRRCDVWLENTCLSDYACSVYRKEFFACGVPALSNAESIHSHGSKKFLFLTRNCREEYGFSLDEALPVFDFFLKTLSEINAKVLVKHHPRDADLESWRSVQDKYAGVEEFSGSLSEVGESFAGCFSFFSTAGLYLVGRFVPVFDVSPYRKRESYDVSLPFHYRVDQEGCVTHDLVYFGVFDKLNCADDLSFLSSRFSMEKISKRQKDSYDEYFPKDACGAILRKLQEM